MLEMYFTGAVVITMVIMLAKEVTNPAYVVFSTLILFTVTGIISVDQAFRGFSNTGMITVGILFVVSMGLQSSGKFIKAIYNLLGSGDISLTKRYFRLLFSVAGLSAFLNNTPIVASLIPMIKSWAKEHDIDASKFLIPLSYAAILGGMCTLIGTSTNLVVHGLLQNSGMEGLSFFEISKIGVPVAVIMLTLLSLFAKYLLPETKTLESRLDENSRDFVAEMKVQPQYPYAGQTVQEAGLRNLKGLFLFQIWRKGKKIRPVTPDEKIHEGDRLFFTGEVDTIFELQKTQGLTVVEDPEFDIKNIDSEEVGTFEAVISKNSSLVGMSVKESNFRNRYDGIILAIHRGGHRIDKKIGDIVLQPADTLFILAKKSFEEKWKETQDFNLITTSLEIFEKPPWKGNLAIALLFVMIFLAATGILPIVIAAAIVAMAMIGLNIVNIKEAKDAIDWKVLVIIASSFGIASALENSGIAELVANLIINVGGIFGKVGIIAGLFWATSQFTWVVTNNAVAALMFPVMMSIGESTGLGMEPLILTLVLGASTCFATPIGYQTNTMVYGTGGYEFKDFLKIGIPMNITVCIIVTIIISVMFL